MQTKWFQPASWRAQDATRIEDRPQQPDAAIAATQMKKPMSASSTGGPVGSPAELLPFEEIYRSAGIKGARMGYSIGKVIEMLQSEHIRSLPTEIRRASLLMALEAAGVQVDDVLQDATGRQRAINSYEAIQRKQLAEYEARKAQENCAIQAEMDRVAAQYLLRIDVNLDEVAREKDVFSKWQTRKQQEAQRIAEAVALCVSQASPAGQNDSAHVLYKVASGKPALSAANSRQ